MKSAILIAQPPPRPFLIYDGDCRFCRFWIHRWQRATGPSVDYLPYQDPRFAAQFPELPLAECERSAQFIGTDGSVYTGTEAALRALAINPRREWLLQNYQRFPWAAKTAESLYRFVASHRPFFSALTRLGWGSAIEPSSHCLVRSVFVRGVALIYLLAFLSLWSQLAGLIGQNGILPAAATMAAVTEQAERQQLGLSRFHAFPTLCWWSATDASLTLQCAAGTALALLVLLGFAPAPGLFLLWVIYLSLTVVSREFLGFQWDNLLLETGFLAIFFSPLQWRLKAGLPPPSPIVLWLLRWLLFRLMFESGWVKILSEDVTWRQFTALQFHYETQPLPTWMGWYAHQLPPTFQKLSTLLMFAIELVVPWLIFGPRKFRQLACLLLVQLQVAILLTGNYCFFNLLTVGLCLVLLDDAALRALVRAKPRPPPDETVAPTPAPKTWRWPWAVTLPLALLILLISTVQLCGMFRLQTAWPRPIGPLYQALAPFRSLNSYGLFAVMTTTRNEIVIEGSNDGQQWQAYEFKYKPGDLQRRPRFVAPHQPRLDWQMWFAALGRVEQNPWLVNLCVRLLQQNQPALALLKNNPFPKAPPRFVRAVMYRYHFSDSKTRRLTGQWWTREFVGTYLPPIALRADDAP